MVGREIAHYYPARSTASGAVRLAVRDLAGPGLNGIDLDVRAGEVVGLAGLDGSGRGMLARALFGAAPAAGQILVDGREVRIRSPRSAIRHGLAYLTADRKAEGLVLGLDATDNARLAVRAVGKSLGVSALGRIAAQVGLDSGVLRGDRRRESRWLPGGGRWRESRWLAGGGRWRESRLLSGGNQQKVVLARWLATDAAVYLLDEPTRGVDVGAKAGIHEVIRGLAEGGAAVLMISSDLPELIGMSDRVVVMRDGRVQGELPAGTTEPEIMLLATGQRPG